MKYVILVVMFFLHIVDDYYLQGVLAQMKQKKWWDTATQYMPNKDLYKNDYWMALLEHAFSWSFVITIPSLVYMFYTGTFGYYSRGYICMIIANTLAHLVVDDLKANKLKINLVQDQLVHFVQIIVTWFILIYFVC